MLQRQAAQTAERTIRHPAAVELAHPDDPRVDFKEILRILRRRRRVILWTAAIPVLIALAYSILATPLYTASTQILIDPRDRRIMSNEVNPEALAADGGVAVVESQMMTITSDTVLQRVVAHENLVSDPEFTGVPVGVFDTLVHRALSGMGLGSEGDTDLQLQALRQIKRRVTVKRSERAFVADVLVTTDSREKSVRIADALTRAYLDDQADARAGASKRASGELVARLEALRESVREAEERVVQYKEDNSIIAAGTLLVNEQQLSEMNIQLNNARARTAEARSRVEQIERAKASDDVGAIAEAVQSQTIGQLRLRHAELVRQQVDLMGKLGPRHPDVATLSSQIRSFQGVITGELARIVAAARNDLQRAEGSERILEANLESLKRKAVSTSQASVRLRELEREVEASRSVYQSFMVRARETNEQQTIDSTNARVISKAAPPRDKSWPPRGLLLAIALVVGLGVGTGTGLMREYFDESVHTREQLEELTALPVLAVIPHLSRMFASRAGLFGLLRSHRPNASSAGATSSETDDPPADLGSSIRDVLAWMLEANRARRGHTMLVTSTGAGEGKTTVALNLAIAAAAAQRRVLLVDADARHRTLSRSPVADASPGLLDVVEGRAKLSSVLLSDSETGVTFLPVGHGERPGGQPASAQEILQYLTAPARSFDLVIIDGSSLTKDLQVQPFAQVVDDILFVARAGVTRKDDVLAAIKGLGHSSRKLCGTILNGGREG